MIRVGITGGIGSGKSTLVKVWEELGAHVLNADEYARELMVTDPLLISEIKETLGEESYHEDGSLNKEHLIQEAFGKGRVGELNAVVHPILRKRTQEYMDGLPDTTPVFAYEAAVLLNEGRPDGFDRILLMLADEQQRLHRVSERDGSNEEDILQRMKAQPDFEHLQHLADMIIRNDGSLEDLKKKAEASYGKIMQDLS
jgi:dephospho-CoA kinase